MAVDVGLFQDIVEVGWASDVLHYGVVFDTVVQKFAGVGVSESPFNSFTETTIDLRGILTGETSGHQVDLRLLTPNSTISFSSVGSLPACAVEPGGFEKFPSGGPPTPTQGGWLAAQIHGSADGPTHHQVSFVSVGTGIVLGTTPNEFCSLASDAPALPGFIHGEIITVTYE